MNANKIVKGAAVAQVLPKPFSGVVMDFKADVDESGAPIVLALVSRVVCDEATGEPIMDETWDGPETDEDGAEIPGTRVKSEHPRTEDKWFRLDQIEPIEPAAEAA